MHIVILTDSYPPEIRSASHLMLECAEEFKRRGHRVTVITTWPRFNLSDNRYNMPPAEFMNEAGIEVLRIKMMRHHKVNYFYRALAELLMPLLFLKKFRRYGVRCPDNVLIYSPPLALANVGRYFLKRGARLILNVQDLFPHNAIDLGVLKNRLPIFFYRSLEKRAYRLAEFITTHSHGNQTFLKNRYPRYQHKFVNIHNWVDLPHYQPRGITNFRQRYGIAKDYCVVVFAGVLGPSQDLTWLLEVARAMQSEPRLLFLIVGDGRQRSFLVKQAKDLTNVMMQHFVSHEEYPDLLDACDLGVVSLSEKNKTPVVPGKLLGYMAGKLPVFAVLNQQSDAHAIIADAGCGFSVTAGNLQTIIAEFQNAYQNRLEWSALGERGFHYASHNFSKERCVGELEALMA